MFNKKSILLALLMPTLTYAIHPGLYWRAPLVNRGGLYDYDADPISGKWGLGLIGAHYRASPKVGFTLSSYACDSQSNGNLQYEKPVVLSGVLTGDVAKVKLFSRLIHIYIPVGIWGAKTTLVKEKKFVTGQGLAFGIGGYYNLSSHFFIDFSWKKLMLIPRFSYQNMSHTSVLTLGFGIRLLSDPFAKRSMQPKHPVESLETIETIILQ